MYGLEGQPIGPEEGVRLLGSVDERKVANDEVGHYRVSTVCLVVDHNWGGGPPLIFETMIFGDGPLDNWQRRYSTPEEALLGHSHACDLAAAGHTPLLERIRWPWWPRKRSGG